MITFLIYFFLFLLLLWVFEKIPGLHLVSKPILDLIIKTASFVFSHSSLWFLWVFRRTWGGHRTIFFHLKTPRKIINPAEERREVQKKL